MYNLIKKITGWENPVLPRKLEKIIGKRISSRNRVLFSNKISLDDFFGKKSAGKPVNEVEVKSILNKAK